MILRQFLHQDPVGISYLFGCGGQGLAAVVDPTGPLEPYLKAAETGGMRIAYVIDTHVHADHISAGPALAKMVGAEYVLSAKADVLLPFTPVNDGDVLALGNVTAQVLHTPGHTPEHISLLVTDRTRAEDPWFVLTGHTLMVGDMGRTELATSLEAGARDLFRSGRRLATLPDYVEVLPGAYAGSVCGRRLSSKPSSTIGFEKRYNEALRIVNERLFVAHMATDVPTPPPQAALIRDINAGRHAPAAHG